MGRKAVPPYEVETITTEPHPDVPGMIRARARYRREVGGSLHNIYGKGKSAAAAKRDLRRNLAEKRGTHHGGSKQIQPNTTVERAALVWLESKRSQRPKLTERTLTEYGKWVAAYIDGTDYGSLTVAAASNVIRGEQHLQAVANGKHKSGARGGEGAMRAARKVMHGVMDTCHRHGAIPSPTRFRLQGRNVEDDRRRIDTDRAFTANELHRVQEVADAHGGDLGDLVAFLSYLGPRIQEALHGVSWEDVDLTGSKPQVTIRGTKTKNAARTVLLPTPLVERLGRRAGLHGRKGLVFGVTRYPSKAGQPRDVANVLNTLREVLDDAGCPWAGSHTFRRTVATMLDENGLGIGAIATVLGQDPVTTSGYIKTRRVGDAAATAFQNGF